MNKKITSKDNEEYFRVFNECLDNLFAEAKKKNEFQFALSLSPEFRGSQDPGWNTAEEAFIAFDQYLEFIHNSEDSPLKCRMLD